MVTQRKKAKLAELKRLMKQAKITQATIAAKTGLSYSWVRQIMCGAEESDSALDQIERAVKELHAAVFTPTWARMPEQCEDNRKTQHRQARRK